MHGPPKRGRRCGLLGRQRGVLSILDANVLGRGLANNSPHHLGPCAGARAVVCTTTNQSWSSKFTVAHSCCSAPPRAARLVVAPPRAQPSRSHRARSYCHPAAGPASTWTPNQPNCPPRRIVAGWGPYRRTSPTLDIRGGSDPLRMVGLPWIPKRGREVVRPPSDAAQPWYRHDLVQVLPTLPEHEGWG